MWQILSPCKKIEAMLWDYSQSRLDVSECSRVELHLQRCERCALALESTKVTLQSMSRLRESSVVLPTNDWEQLRSRLLAPQPHAERARVGVMQVAAFGCSALLITYVGVKTDLLGVNNTHLKRSPTNATRIEEGGASVSTRRHIALPTPRGAALRINEVDRDEAKLAPDTIHQSTILLTQQVRQTIKQRDRRLKQEHEAGAVKQVVNPSKSVDGDIPGIDETPQFIKLDDPQQADSSNQLLQQPVAHSSETILPSTEQQPW